jgi:membrane protease YdiL (CAAX protease family)
VAFGFALFLWLVPALIEQGTAMQQKRDVVVSSAVLLFLLHFIGTLLPAFGEEFGWRGYLLPKLATKYGVWNGLLVHAFIWWFWHLPVVIGMGIQESNNANTGIGGILLFTAITIIPSMLHAVIYAWIWARSGSVFVATIYHAAFDEVRDVLEKTIGFGYFTEVWQMVTIIVVGGLLLWKANWRLLLAGKSREQAIALHPSSLLNTN